jgi:hypothetical protein
VAGAAQVLSADSAPPVDAGGRDSSASDVTTSVPRAALSSTAVASNGRTHVELDKQIDNDPMLVVLRGSARG